MSQNNYCNWYMKDNKLYKAKYIKENTDYFFGTFENALKYFGVNNTSDTYGDLYNIIIYHQTNPNVITKTSAELFNILINAASTKKYWISLESDKKNPSLTKRFNTIIDLLKRAKREGLIYDNDILHDAIKSNKESQLKRVYKQNEFTKQLMYAGVVI